MHKMHMLVIIAILSVQLHCTYPVLVNGQATSNKNNAAVNPDFLDKDSVETFHMQIDDGENIDKGDTPAYHFDKSTAESVDIDQIKTSDNLKEENLDRDKAETFHMQIDDVDNVDKGDTPTKHFDIIESEDVDEIEALNEAVRPSQKHKSAADALDKLKQENLDKDKAESSNRSDTDLQIIKLNYVGIFSAVFKGSLNRNNFKNWLQDVSYACLNDTEQVIVDIGKMKEYALRFVDAEAKVPPGLKQGLEQWTGDYHECLETVSEYNHHTKHTFKGRYFNLRLKRVTIDVCFPDSCNKADVKELFRGIFDALNVNFIVYSAEMRDIRASDVVTIFLFCVLVALGLTATVVDYLTGHFQQKSVVTLQSTAAASQDTIASQSQVSEQANIRINTSVNINMDKKDIRERADTKTDDNQHRLVETERVKVQPNGYQGNTERAGTSTNASIDQSKTVSIMVNKRVNNGVKFGNEGINEEVNICGPDTVTEGRNDEPDNEDKNEENETDMTDRTKLLSKGGQAGETMKTSKVETLVRAFSIVRNTQELMTVKRRNHPLTCLNGVRVLSISWILLGHVYEFCKEVSGIDYYTNKDIHNTLMLVIPGSAFAVDTFFFISGLLQAYLSLKQLAVKGRINWLLEILYRYIRLTPVYAFTLLYNVTLFSLLISGPFGWRIRDENLPMHWSIKSCEKYWWTNLLYINNLYPYLGPRPNCMGWSWYLANDMQFHILLGPILLFLLHKKAKLGIGFCVGLVGVCVAIRAFIASYYGLTVFYPPFTKHVNDKYIQESLSPIYQKPYARMAVYVTGVMMGYFLHKTRFNFRMNRTIAVTGWLVFLATGLSLIFGSHSLVVYHKENMDAVAVFGDTLYEAVYRPVWGLVIGWLVLACSTGYGGWINSFLSWKIWAPLVSLTYSTYLVHELVINAVYYNMVSPMDYSILMMTITNIACLVISFAVAFVVYILVEAPFMELNKMLLQNKR